MSKYFLYHMPGACSRVALNALEEVGKLYGEQGVGLLRGEQREPTFLAINPKGKMPGRTVSVDRAAVARDKLALPSGGDL